MNLQIHFHFIAFFDHLRRRPFGLFAFDVSSQFIVICRALQALDRDRDGFITKKEFQMMNKTMTPTQVNRKRNDFLSVR